MEGHASYFTNKIISLPRKTKEFIRGNPTIQKNHEKAEYQMDKTQTHSSHTIGPVRRKKPGIGTKIMDKHRGKCRLLSRGWNTI